MEAGAIASWNKEEGDSFGAGDILCSVETDKATVDFEAQDEGVVAKILVPAGPDEIKCGQPILITVENEGDVAAFKDYVVDASAAAAAPAAPAEAPPAPAAPAPTPAAAVPTAAPPTPAPAATPSSSGGRVVASPLAHMIAKELGHDLSTIQGTGPDGRIIAADVREFVPSAQPTAAAAAAAPAPAQTVITSAPPIPGAGYTDYPLSESAQEVAARLTKSKQNVPHYYLTVDITMDELLALRSTLASAMNKDKGSTLGVYELMIKAAAASMKAVPSANASWMDSVVRVFDSIDINVVVGSGDNLYTPVIRDCGGRGIASISEELNAAVSVLDEDGEEGASLTPSFGAMGTFTIMNLGMFGIKSCAPIIREPQACALALGALENRIVPNDDPDSEEIYKQSVVMTATLSCDHRVVDGAVGAQWLSAFKSHLENPSTLLL